MTEDRKQTYTEKEAAEYINMSRSYLAKARMTGEVGRATPGPKYLKIGRAIRYRKNDLDIWLDTHCKET